MTSKVNYSSMKDYELVESFKKGNKHSAEILLKKYAGLLTNTSVKKFKQFHHVTNLEFEDAAQDMYLLFFEALNDIDITKIIDKNGFNVYIHFVQRVCRYNDYHIRKINNYGKFNRLHINEYYMQEIAKSSSMCIDYSRVVKDVFEVLTELEKPIFTLFMDGKTPSEISRKLGMTKQNISYHMKHIKEKAVEIGVGNSSSNDVNLLNNRSFVYSANMRENVLSGMYS
jgi:DNA-directed RNA polymerase specialized sigma subunit